MHLNSLSGSFTLRGHSLAALGDPVGISLPTTGPFETYGKVIKDGDIWQVDIGQAKIGTSRLNGTFSFNPQAPTRVLSGELGGERLVLADLGPAIGGSNVVNNKSLNKVTTFQAREDSKKVLPDRKFDLKALRSMNADIVINIRELYLNTSRLEPLRPLKGHLKLNNGILTLTHLEATSAQGQITGNIKLDGRSAQALWEANLDWDNMNLNQWIKQERAMSSVPFITGRFTGEAKLSGKGQSSAEILASLEGKAYAQIRSGTISHLLLELAGIDISQGLTEFLKADESLSLSCALAELNIKEGVVFPHLVVLDTKDSAIWITGNISLASEQLALKTIVIPKDFSLLSLRTPIIIKGSFENPNITLEKKSLVKQIGAAVLLGLINPLAAFIPLLDSGDKKEAERLGASCRQLINRTHLKLSSYKKN